MIAAVDRLTELGRVEHSTIAGIAAVYLPEYYEAETAIAARIRAMAQHPPAPLPDAERVLQGIEADGQHKTRILRHKRRMTGCRSALCYI